MQGKEVQSSVTIHTPHTSACAAATGHRAPVTFLKFPESYQSYEQRNCSHNHSLTPTSRRCYTLLASFPSSLLSLGMRLCNIVVRYIGLALFSLWNTNIDGDDFTCGWRLTLWLGRTCWQHSSKRWQNPDTSPRLCGALLWQWSTLQPCEGSPGPPACTTDTETQSLALQTVVDVTYYMEFLCLGLQWYLLTYLAAFVSTCPAVSPYPLSWYIALDWDTHSSLWTQLWASLSTLLSQGTQQLAPGLSYPKGHVQWYTKRYIQWYTEGHVQ